MPSLIGPNTWIIFAIIFTIATALGIITLFVFTSFNRSKLWSRLVWVGITILSLSTLGLFIFASTTKVRLGQDSNCGSLMEIRNLPLAGQKELTVSQLAIFYMLPLINFMFLSSSPYTIPFHQKLRQSDENGMVGFKTLLLSSFTALTFYSLVYLLVNLIQTKGSEFVIPLLYQYVLMSTGIAAIPILLLTLIITCFQLFYDL